MAQPARNDRRTADLAMIHMAAKTLFGDVSRGGVGREEYEDWLEARTGKRSAGALSQPERIELVKRLRKDGVVPDRARAAKGGKGDTRTGAARPTSAQWGRIGGLARQIGWDAGLSDPALARFVERTAKVTSTRFLTRDQASKVILGLERWLASRAGGDCDAMS